MDNQSEGSKNKTKRFRRIVIGAIFGILFLVLLIWFLVPVSLKALFGHRQQVVDQVLRDAIVFHVPSARIRSISSQQGIMSLKANCRYTQGMGVADREITLVIPNYIGSISNTYQLNSQGFNFNDASIPDISSREKAWAKLENIGDISVCQAAVLFSEPISIEQCESFLSGVDAKTNYTWAAVDSGAVDLHPKLGAYTGYGFPMNVAVFGEERVVKESSLKQAALDFRTEMKFYEDQSRYLGDKQLTDEVRAVNQYIIDNGIRIKGVVLLAPTKSILKYKNSDLISNIDVIKAELDYKLEY